MKRDARELWSKRVERWKDSGLSAKEFAQELGINANTLAYWGWRLKAKGAPPRARPRTKPELRFVEVVPAAGANALSIAAATIPSGAVESASPAPEGPTPEPLEVVMQGGLRIRVPVHFDGGSLRRVVDALAAEAS